MTDRLCPGTGKLPQTRAKANAHLHHLRHTQGHRNKHVYRCPHCGLYPVGRVRRKPRGYA